jgi:hypothetical protein
MARRSKAETRPPDRRPTDTFGSAELAATGTKQRSLRLEGLEPDNFLAFLALLGLLRALDTARPEWKARAHWDLDAHPWRPMLTVREDVTQTAVLDAVAKGLDCLVKDFDFGDRKDINYSIEEARKEFEQASQGREDLLSALMSDAVVKEKGSGRDRNQVAPTPYCLLFGQGHQHFLVRLANVPRQKEPPARGRGRARIQLSETQCLAEALFAPWQRPDLTDGFRWDPAEDRRYALRANDPSGDPVGLQHGANRLAAIALPLLSGAPILRRSELKFLARGASYSEARTISITWPLWPHPARLASIRALLAHPWMAYERLDDQQIAEGVTALMRAERISSGKFMNISGAQCISFGVHGV